MKKKSVKKTESAKEVTKQENSQSQRVHPLQAWDEMMFARRPQPKDQSEKKE